MSLTLAIRNFDRLDNGMPTEFVLHQRGAIIGRSPTCDWSLPDPRNYVSSRHCEITFEDGFYSVTDISTNGTFLNGSPERMAGPRRVENGDLFLVGQYEVSASLSGQAAAAFEREAEAGAEAARQGEWAGWDGQAGAAAPPAPPPAAGGWDSPPAAPASGGGWEPRVGPSLAQPDAYRSSSFGTPPPPPPAPISSGWSPSARAPDIPAASTWEAQAPAPDPASEWSSAAPDRPPAPSADDVWGKIAEGNVVDWARGGFGQPIEENRDPLGLNKPQAKESLPKATPQMAQFGSNDSWAAAPQAAPPPPAAPAPARAPTAALRTAPAPAARPGDPGASATALVEAFAAAAGLQPGQLKDLSPTTIDRAGQLFRRLVAGLVVMVEARARAKSQMGAEATSFAFDGNNPIKFSRSPEEAILQLLNPQQKGFMEAGRAIEDSFFDLQSHQMATLRAMQGALKATLDRFSPTAIRKRAESKGLLARILPIGRDAALWQAYEKEFGGVAQGSDEAFMDVFAKEFRKAYEEQANSQRRR